MVDLISLLIVSYLEALETTGRYEGGKYLNILRCAGEAATDNCADATLEEVESGIREGPKKTRVSVKPTQPTNQPTPEFFFWDPP